MNKAAAVALAAVVGVGAATVSAAAWMGGTAVEQLRAQNEQLGKLAPSFKVVDEHVERGLFRSSYDVRVRFGCMPKLPAVPGAPALPAAPGEPLELGFHTEVRHGPLLASGFGFAQLDSTVRVPEAWQARVEAVAGKEPPLHVRTTLGFDRGFQSELTVPALRFSDPQAGSFESAALKAKVRGSTIDPSQGGSYEYELPGWTLHTSAPDATMELSVGRVQATLKLGPRKDQSLWFADSESSGTITDLSFLGSAASTLGGAPTSFKAGFPALTVSSHATLDKGLYASEVSYSGRATFNSFKVDKVELKGGLRRLDAAGYQALLKHLLDGLLSCDASGGSLEAAFPALERDAVALMMHDPEYALDTFAIELDGQRGELSYSLGTKGVKPDDAQRALLDLAMERGVLHAHVKVQLGLLDAIDKRMASGGPGGAPGGLRAMADFAVMQFGEAGYVVQTGDALESALEYDNGQLLLNGKPPALPDLGGLVGGP